MRVVFNQVFVSKQRLDSREFLASRGYSLEELEKTVTTTGFEKLSRFPDQNMSDLLERLRPELNSAFRQSSSIPRAVIFVSQSNDRRIPNGASIIQQIVGLPPQTICLEIVEGCNGFVKALHLLNALLNEGDFGLVVAAEMNSSMVSNSAPGTAVLFGDGLSLTMIEKTDEFQSEIYQDGLRGEAISFGLTVPNLVMDGFKVFSFAAQEIPILLQNASLVEFDEACFPVFHQASKLVVDFLSRKCELTKVPYAPFNSEHIGNTGPVSLPAWLANEKELPLGSEQILLGFGSGLSWGYARVVWYASVNELLEV